MLLLLALITDASLQSITREKRTIEFFLHKFADTFGFQVIPKERSSKILETRRLSTLSVQQPTEQPFVYNFNIFGTNDQVE